MIISDLQHMDSVDSSAIKGASGYGGFDSYKGRGYDHYYRKNIAASADSSADAQAFGDLTDAFTRTSTVADAELGFSGATSDSGAVAFSSKYASKY